MSDLVAAAYGIADDVTKGLGLQSLVTWAPWVRQEGDGEPVFGTAEPLSCIVVDKQQFVADPDGQSQNSNSYLAVLKPPAANGAPGRKEPIDVRDSITLPDGTAGSIINVAGGVLSDVTGLPYGVEVYLK